jgi:ferredoxin
MSRREFLRGTVGNPHRLIDPSAMPVNSGKTKGITDMKVTDSCTLCNACTESCLEQALGIQENELIFYPERCTGCGDCARKCPEHSITLSEIDEPLTLQARAVYRDEMVRCAKCNTPYASAKMLRKISEMLDGEAPINLCPNCKQTEFYKTLSQSTPRTQ